jgi:hypothetical protein
MEFKLSTLIDLKVTLVCERKSMAEGLNWSSSSEAALNRKTYGVIEPPRCFDETSSCSNRWLLSGDESAKNV